MTRGNKCGILPSLALDLWRDGWAGLRRTTGNRVTAVNRTRVRIPISPPYKKVSLSRHFLLFFCRVLIQKHGFLLYWVPTGNKPVKTISAGTISLHPGTDWWKKEVEWKTEISWCPFFSRTLSPRFKVYASGNIPHASPCTSMGENLWHMMLPEVSMQTMLDIAGAYAGSEQHRLLFLWMKKRGWTYYSPGMPAVVVRGITTQKSNGTPKTLKECAPWFTLIILSISENEKY